MSTAAALTEHTARDLAAAHRDLARTMRELVAAQRLTLPQWWTMDMLRERYSLSHDSLKSELIASRTLAYADFGRGLHPRVPVEHVLLLDDYLRAKHAGRHARREAETQTHARVPE